MGAGISSNKLQVASLPAVLTYDIQAECHRNLWLRIHLALVDAAVTWLRIFHMQRPILGVGGAYDLQAKRIDKSLRLKLSLMLMLKRHSATLRGTCMRGCVSASLGKFNQCIQVVGNSVGLAGSVPAALANCIRN